MSELGDMLRQAREKKGLTAAQVAVETHIRGKVILALESGEYSQLPPEPFARGLIRNYARFLALDPDILLDAFAIETGSKPPTPPPPSTPEPESLAGTTNFLEQDKESRPKPIFVFPPDETNVREPNAGDGNQRSRELPPFLSPQSHSTTPVGFAAEPIFRSSPLPFSTAMQGVTTRESPALFGDGSKPVFQVATEIPAEVTPEDQIKAVDTPLKAEWIRRLSATSLPELVAVITLGLALLVVGAFGYTRFFASSKQVAQVEITPTPVSKATPQRSQTVLPTPVPTFLASPLLAAGTPFIATAATVRGVPNTVVAVSGEALLGVEITAGDTPVWAWIVVDNAEVFKGNLQNETRSWSAHARLYLQVRDISTGSLSFNGKTVLPRVFAERKLLERAWEVNTAGTPSPVEALPFTTSISQATQTSVSGSSATRTESPPSTSIPNDTLVPGQTPAPSPTTTGPGSVGSAWNPPLFSSREE